MYPMNISKSLLKQTPQRKNIQNKGMGKFLSKTLQQGKDLLTTGVALDDNEKTPCPKDEPEDICTIRYHQFNKVFELYFYFSTSFSDAQIPHLIGNCNK